MIDIKDFFIGARLVSIDADSVTVTKDNKTYSFDIIEDEGGCCGFGEFSTQLFISDEELNRNPAIIDVEYIEDDTGDGDSAILTFFGEYKPMAEISAYASSGSGWCYGASVSLVCSREKINYILAEW